jgi:very-short-patch-repair endonuclease
MISFIGSLDHALNRLKTTHTSKFTHNSNIPAQPTVVGITERPFRYAQSQVTYTQPQFYSPLHTPQNWQIPSKRREVYQWLRYFSENEPKVAAALNFYSSFPMNGFETQCDDSKVKRFFDNVNKKLNLDYWCKMISREYYMIGDVFPFLEIKCDQCNGTNIDKSGKLCQHKGGTFSRMVVLNPDWIDVQANQFSEDPVITMIPDDDLKRVVWHKRPKALYDRLPPHIRQLILSGRPIPLDNNNVSHLKHDPYPYGVYGTSIVRRLFKTLTYKDKLMTAQWITAERLILPIRVVKVGDAERPAGPSDIADVQQQLAQTASDPNLTLVTHHAFDYDWVGANGKVLTLSNEFDLINKEILQGLMINEALLSGEMAGYQSAAIGAEALIQRMESWRLELARWIENKIYKPIAQMQGFLDEAASEELGEAVWIYPKIKWNDLNLRDDTQIKQLWMQLHDKQVLSTESLCEKFDIHYDQEVERIRFENAQQQMGGGQPGGAGAAGGGMPGGDMGGGMGGGMGGAPPAGGDMGGAGDMGAPPTGPAPMGAPPAGGPAAMASSSLGGSAGKLLSSGRSSQLKPADEEAVQPAGVRLTSLEQIMFKMLTGMRQQQSLPFQPWMQYPLGPYRVDFAIPQLKLAIECDGEMHQIPDKKASDNLRDATLSKYGWTTVRFTEVDLKEHVNEVQKTVASLIFRLWKKALDQQKKQKEAMDKFQRAAGSIEEIRLGNVVGPNEDGWGFTMPAEDSIDEITSGE